MSKSSRLLSIMLVISLLFTLFPYASATDVSPRYVKIQSFFFDFSIDSLGTAECKGSIEVRDTSLVKISLKLQRYQNGSWVTVETWSKTGAGIASLYKTKTVAHGYTYRLVVTGYAYDANNVLIETDEGIRSSHY